MESVFYTKNIFGMFVDGTEWFWLKFGLDVPEGFIEIQWISQSFDSAQYDNGSTGIYSNKFIYIGNSPTMLNHIYIPAISYIYSHEYNLH